MALLYLRLRTDFGPEQRELLSGFSFGKSALFYGIFILALIPINWALESRKWQIITEPVEAISFAGATRSVYSGLCLGNFAPGRATEFLGKILYFSDENKSRVTLLHFIGGMIQLSITLALGLWALIHKAGELPDDLSWLVKALPVLSILLFLLFSLAILRVNSLMNYISKLVARRKNLVPHHYNYPASLWLKLFMYSILRYLVFSVQFLLVLMCFAPDISLKGILPGIALYFMLSSVLPMIPVLEAAMRAALAVLVLGQSGLSVIVLSLAALLIWIMNIVIPSLIGYLILLRMQFDFKLFFRKKHGT